MFSDAFSEGQTRDINGRFPPNSNPYTEDYDYLSDSDLEDESSCSDEGDEDLPGTDCDSQQRCEDTPNQKASQTVIPDESLPHPSSVEITEAQNHDR